MTEKMSAKEKKDCKMSKKETNWLQKCLKRKVTAKMSAKEKRTAKTWKCTNVKRKFIVCGVLIFCYQVFVWETTFLRSFFAKFMHSNSILHTKEII